MRDRFTAWAPLALLILLALLTFWLSRTVEPPSSKGDGNNRHDPDYIVENFTATRMGLDGLPQHVLVAQKMVHFPDDDTTHLTAPDFTRYKADSPPMHIRSTTGLVSRNGEDVYFNDDVKVTRDAYADRSQMTLTTTYLHVIPDKELALTDKPVTIQNANTIVHGVGLELNNKTHDMKLFSGVKGRYDKQKH